MPEKMLPEDRARVDMWASVAEILLALPQLVIFFFIKLLPMEYHWMIWFPIVTGAGLLLLVTVRTVPSWMIPIPARPWKDRTFR